MWRNIFHIAVKSEEGNVVIDTDPAGNIKVTKAKSKEKIDGIVAAIMALDRCIRQEGQGGSVYDMKDLRVVRIIRKLRRSSKRVAMLRVLLMWTSFAVSSRDGN